MIRTPAVLRWGTPAYLGIAAGLGGVLIFGLLGGLVGVFAGFAAARDLRAVLLAAGFALFVTAMLTILEQPLDKSRIIGFPQQHGAANVVGGIAAVLLLAGLVGLFAQRQAPARERPGRRAISRSSRAPISTLVAVLAATLLGCLALSQFGDRDWGAAPIVLGILVLLLAMALGVWRYLPGVRGGHRDA